MMRSHCQPPSHSSGMFIADLIGFDYHVVNCTGSSVQDDHNNHLYNTIICNTIKPPTMVNGITFWAFNIPPTPMLPTSLLEEAMHVHNQSCIISPLTIALKVETLSDYISLAIFLESATKRRPCTDNFTYIRVTTMRAFSSSTSCPPLPTSSPNVGMAKYI